MTSLPLFFLSAALLGTPGAEPVDFDTDVLPVLTKAGCNAAACHGAAAGRGGFRLSLFGGDPAADYDSIARELESRRINQSRPAESLLILKPTEQLDHEGGMRFEYDSPQAKLLADWIRQGARRQRVRKLVELQVNPRTLLASDTPAARQLQVMAIFDDGSARDVTAQSVYAPADPAAVMVNESGELSLLRGGRHTVAVRYLSQVKTVQATVPLRAAPIETAPLAGRNWIDDEINGTLAALHLPASGPADEPTLLRRVTLDLTGRLPAPDAVRDFVASRDEEKYSALVDRLLASPEFTEYWTYRFARLLRIRAQPKDKQGAREFHGWLEKQIEAGNGLDQIAVALLTAEGDTHEHGPANFYLVARDARSQAEYVSEALLGIRLRCANCHNHPLDRWTQDDYHGLAAVFARIERGRIVRAGARGEVAHPRTGEAAVPRIPGERFLPPASDGRSEFARWLVEPDNPFFARAHVNRLWKALTGRGLVEPTDDLRATNPATHPELLDRLAEDFAAHGFDIRHTLRTIANSAAYMRSSDTAPGNEADERFYSHALVRPLEPEVLLDAIADVSGVAEEFPDSGPQQRAIALFDPAAPSVALDLLGRCSREDSCESAEGAAGGLTTTLHMINGELINRRVVAEEGRLQQRLAAGADVQTIIDDFYTRALSRSATEEEQKFWRERLDDNDADARRRKLEDFVWSLLCSREFRSNH